MNEERFEKSIKENFYSRVVKCLKHEETQIKATRIAQNEDLFRFYFLTPPLAKGMDKCDNEKDKWDLICYAKGTKRRKKNSSKVYQRYLIGLICSGD